MSILRNVKHKDGPTYFFRKFVKSEKLFKVCCPGNTEITVHIKWYFVIRQLIFVLAYFRQQSFGIQKRATCRAGHVNTLIVRICNVYWNRYRHLKENFCVGIGPT